MNKDWKGDTNSVYKIIGATNHAIDKDREEHDFYATSPTVLDIFSKRYNIPKNVLECAAGEGHLSEKLKELGHNVISYDIVQRNYPLDKVCDFFDVKEMPEGYNCILSNPPYNCVDITTECYTKRGWLTYDKLNSEDEILSINPTTLMVEWSKINKIIVKDIDEEIYHFKKSHLDILCTGEHRMFAFYSGKIVTTKGDLIKAREIQSKYYIPRIGYEWEGKNLNAFTLPSVTQNERYTRKEIIKPEKHIPMENWLKFFGMWLADGYCRDTKNSLGKPRYIVGIKQSSERGDMVRDILNLLPFVYKEYMDDYGRKNSCINFEIYDKQLWSYLHQFGKSYEKYIPKEIKELACDSLKILLKYYFSGDGSYTKLLKQGDVFTFRTISKQLAEDVQEILLKSGYLSHITITPYVLHNGEHRVVYQQQVAKDSMYNKYHYPSCKHSKEHYKGKVWCPNLEKNGVFLARRNGKEFITGNCAMDFTLHSLELLSNGGQCIMFLKTTFLEGKERYKKLFSTKQLKYVYVFSQRQICAKNANFENVKSSAVSYSFFIFEKGFCGEPIIRWL